MTDTPDTEVRDLAAQIVQDRSNGYCRCHQNPAPCGTHMTVSDPVDSNPAYAVGYTAYNLASYSVTGEFADHESAEEYGLGVTL